MSARNTPLEILAPAGNEEMLRAAVYSGADAVYLGFSGFNARKSAGNFTAETLKDAVAFCHGRGVRVHVALNTTVYPGEVQDLADAIHYIIENRKMEGNEGIYHYSNEGVCSWFDFTKAIAEMAGNTGCDIQPCHSDEFPSPVKRPAYSVLDKTKFKSTFGLSVPYWTDSLKHCISKA